MNDVHRLIMMVGLPRSGKSTKARSMGYPIVSPDAIRLALHGQPFIASAEPMVWATAKLMVVALFEAGHTTVTLDACNITVARRAEWKDKRWKREFHLCPYEAEPCRMRAVREGKEYLLPIIDRMAAEREPLDLDGVERVLWRENDKPFHTGIWEEK